MVEKSEGEFVVNAKGVVEKIVGKYVNPKSSIPAFMYVEAILIAFFKNPNNPKITEQDFSRFVPIGLGPNEIKLANLMTAAVIANRNKLFAEHDIRKFKHRVANSESAQP